MASIIKEKSFPKELGKTSQGNDLWVDLGLDFDRLRWVWEEVFFAGEDDVCRGGAPSSIMCG